MVASQLDVDRPVKRALVLSGGGGRGAFECGVLEQLDELGWQPDVLVGTSIGAMNAAVWAIGGVKRTKGMWDHIRTRDMHRFRWWPFSWRKSFFDRKPWKQTLDNFASENILAQVKVPLYIVTTNIETGHPVIYTNHRDLDQAKPLYEKVDAINHRHLLASSSIPYLYEATRVSSSEHGDEHWDGAVMYNSPLRPAIDAGATEILVVLLSPYHIGSRMQGHLPPAPKGAFNQIGYVLDLALIATFENDFEQMRSINRRTMRHPEAAKEMGYRLIHCSLIGPEDWITPADIIRYRPDRINALRQIGRDETKRTFNRMALQGWDSLLAL